MKKIMNLIILILLPLGITISQDFEKSNYGKLNPYYSHYSNDADSMLTQLILPAPENCFITPFEIDSTDSIGSVVNLAGYKLLAIRFPSAFTGATITIQTSADTVSANFKTVQYNDADISIAATDGKQCAFIPVEIWQLLRYVRIVSVSAEADDRSAELVLGR